MAKKVSFKIDGAKELVRDFNKAALIQQSSVTKAARAGAKIALAAAKSNAPVETGQLKKGIILRPEKTRAAKSGKKVYQVTLDNAMNDVFQSQSKSAVLQKSMRGPQKGKMVLKFKSYYYPASMEYGYRTKGGGYVPGFHYLRDALMDNKDTIERVVISKMWSDIQKALTKRGK